ncbi:MAG: SspB family protein [Minwuia sp.]|uniref:SspB family protein n=1 Tax=Minwuia sp. TaxID=2493630 RepID=UPI003A8B2E67
MDYSQMVENALKGVVRAAMEKASTDGLQGNHHFYVTFLTRFAGVELPDHLLERYPNDITIVLQHQFWDMEVGDEAFEVSLSFNKLPTRIRVPYDAITSFADPSVQFGLQFQPAGMAALPVEGDNGSFPEPAPTSQDDAEERGEAEAAAESDTTGEVVSLDAFRKKS